MTFYDDTLVFMFGANQVRLTCKELGLSWPPPGKLKITGAKPLPEIEFTLIGRSMMSDADRAKTNLIYRTATYVNGSH